MPNDTQTAGVQTGITILGQVIGQPKPQSGESKNGGTWHRLQVQLLCGDQVVRLSTYQNTPFDSLPKNGEIIRVNPTPGFKDNGVLCFDGTFSKHG